jgi:hypothetical protein
MHDAPARSQANRAQRDARGRHRLAYLVLHLWVRELGSEVASMSTRCQIEFRNGSVRRTVYRHWDGYPRAVIPHLLAFLQWSTCGGDIEYEAANFLYWSKQGLDERSVQLGFGICANDELHGDSEYFYVVEHTAGGTVVRAHVVEHEDGAPRIGRLVQELVVPQSLSSSSPSAPRMAQALPRVQIDGVWYFRDERWREFRRCDNPHERIMFENRR